MIAGTQDNTATLNRTTVNGLLYRNGIIRHAISLSTKSQYIVCILS